VALIAAGWAAAALLVAWVGYASTRALFPGKPGDEELVRELRVIRQQRYYEGVEDLEMLQQLDDPDLFGDRGGAWVPTEEGR
jgi:hypothetical protein